MGISRAAFLAEIEASAADDEDSAAEIELKMISDVRDDKYVALNDKRLKVGVAGNPTTAIKAPSTAS